MAQASGGAALEGAATADTSLDSRPGTHSTSIPQRPERQRRGRVRLEGRTFVDDGGPFLATGATLFWALWGYQNDRARLEANLDYLARTGAIDYIRVLGTVGGGGWSDRAVDARADGWQDAVAGLTDLAYDRFGLRLQWTLFGELHFAPTPADRVAAVDRLLKAIRGREHKVVLIETANEAWHTGFDGERGLAELRALTRRLNQGTDVLVAASSNHDSPELFCRTYAGGIADVATIHLDRAVGASEGPWRPVAQPWTYPGVFPCRDLPPAISNEPIGPYSSVAADSEPARLVAQVVAAHIAGFPASVVHAGPGIYGGGEGGRERGRPANLWEAESLTETLRGLAAVKALLPPDLPQWTREPAASPRAPFTVDLLRSTSLPLGRTGAPGAGGAGRAGGQGAVGAFSGTSGSEAVTLVFGIRRQVDLTARRPMSVELVRLPGGVVVERKSLGEGETLRLDEAKGAWVILSDHARRAARDGRFLLLTRTRSARPPFSSSPDGIASPSSSAQRSDRTRRPRRASGD
ncbi:MAG: hypothetical protein ACE148_17035 [Vicinamibacterales bacterium]